MNKDCIVIIPVYRPLVENEIVVVKQAVWMTQGFTKVFIAPSSFTPDSTFNDFKDISIERFDDRFFTGVQSYNQLMLDVDFYKRFREYKYILIHQTDAYLFKPELQYWCDKNYDYIGAPWYAERKLPKYNLYNFLFRYGRVFYKKETLLRRKHFNAVGNGGLSLRKVGSFISVLEKTSPRLIAVFTEGTSNFFNEDIFWSLEAPLINKRFKIPGWQEAIYFSLENYPEISYEMMNHTLPFGCHAFDSGTRKFWQQFIPFKIKPRPGFE